MYLKKNMGELVSQKRIDDILLEPIPGELQMIAGSGEEMQFRIGVHLLKA